MKTVLICAVLIASSTAWATTPRQSKKQHVITKGDIAIVHDCHVIYLDADEAYRQEQAQNGSARLERPQHSTAYSCYTAEKPVYDTLLEMDVRDQLSEEGKKLFRLVGEDTAYFQLSLDDDEK